MMKMYSSLISDTLVAIEKETDKQSANMDDLKRFAFLRITALNFFLNQNVLGSPAEQTRILSTALKVLGRKDDEYMKLSSRLDNILLPLQTSPPPENFPAYDHPTFGATLENKNDEQAQYNELYNAFLFQHDQNAEVKNVIGELEKTLKCLQKELEKENKPQASDFSKRLSGVYDKFIDHQSNFLKFKKECMDVLDDMIDKLPFYRYIFYHILTLFVYLEDFLPDDLKNIKKVETELSRVFSLFKSDNAVASDEAVPKENNNHKS